MVRVLMEEAWRSQSDVVLDATVTPDRIADALLIVRYPRVRFQFDGGNPVQPSASKPHPRWLLRNFCRPTASARAG